MIALFSDRDTELFADFNVTGGIDPSGFSAQVFVNGSSHSFPKVAKGRVSVKLPKTDFSSYSIGTVFELKVVVKDAKGAVVVENRDFGRLMDSSEFGSSDSSNTIAIMIQREFKVPTPCSPSSSGGGGEGGLDGTVIVDVFPESDATTEDVVDAVALCRYNFSSDTVSQLSDGITINLPMPEAGEIWTSVKMVDFRFDGSGMAIDSTPVIFRPDGSVNSISEDCGVIDKGKVVFSTAVFNGTNWDVFWTQGELKTNPF